MTVWLQNSMNMNETSIFRPADLYVWNDKVYITGTTQDSRNVLVLLRLPDQTPDTLVEEKVYGKEEIVGAQIVLRKGKNDLDLCTVYGRCMIKIVCSTTYTRMT